VELIYIIQYLKMQSLPQGKHSVPPLQRSMGNNWFLLFELYETNTICEKNEEH
jgi:hypothetical protein